MCYDGKWALKLAENFGSEKLVELFVKGKVDVNKYHIDGYVVQWGHDKCIELLLKAWADVNKRDNISCTALLHTGQIYRCAKLLLRYGASINLLKNYGYQSLLGCLPTLTGNTEETKQVIEVLYAAGERINERYFQVPNYLKTPELSLKHLCRETIREHLLDINPHQYLFGRIPQLGLPSLIAEYLLYNISLNDDDEDLSQYSRQIILVTFRPRT